MNRRRFVFGSLASAALFAPLLKGRRAAAAGEPPRRLFVWVCSGGYPYAEDFFPESGDAFTTPILRALEPVREQALVVDGVDIRPTGPRPRGNDHIRSIGKVITARDVFDIGGDEGEPGGPSIDHVVAEHLGLRKTLVLVEQRQPRSWLARRQWPSLLLQERPCTHQKHATGDRASRDLCERRLRPGRDGPASTLGCMGREGSHPLSPQSRGCVQKPTSAPMDTPAKSAAAHGGVPR